MANRPAGGSLLIIERILRDRAGIWRQIAEERDLRGLIGQMLASSAISLALFGAVLGASYGWEQALSSLIKLPLLFLVTLAICLPTLYLFNLVFGARLSVVQAVALILVSVTVTAVLTLAFAPISLFFLATAQNYELFKLLNVAILTLTAVVGLRFLTGGMRTLNEHQELAAHEPAEVAAAAPLSPPVPAEMPAVPALVPGNGAEDWPAPAPVPASVPGSVPLQAAVHPLTVPVPPQIPLRAPHQHIPQRVPARETVAAPRSASMSLLYIWILLFGFVGTQLAWTLRPFFGDPGRPFALFRHLNGTFYADIVHTIGHLLGG
jgi:hypothetical protein